MHSVQSELISKTFADMCIRDCNDSSCEDSKHSNVQVGYCSVAESCSLNFGDGNCGEARPTQHVLLNFTPDDEQDTEASQDKCCAFWDFIKNIPEIQPSVVDKELTRLMKESCNRKEASTPTSSHDTESEVPHATAVSMLSFVQKKGYIDRLFEVKTTKSQCSLGPKEYPHDEAKKINKKVYDCTCRSCSHSGSKTDVRTLNTELEKFDKDHPKTMEPPGHYPELKHCILQRKVDNKSYLQ